MKCLPVLLATLLVAGCSVGVTHHTEDESHDEQSSAVQRSRTAVAVGILKETEPRHEHNVPSAIQSPGAEQSKTTVTVIVPESSSQVEKITRSPDRSIQVTGRGNTVVVGDVHLHHHKHVYIHQPPKLAPVQVNVCVELDDRISERERRRRMVERRIATFFPHYRD